MNKRLRKVLVRSLVAFSYISPVALGIWRLLRHEPLADSSKAPPNTPHAPEPKTKSDNEELESLSLTTPGDAPLDRLARTAVREKTGAQPQHPDGQRSEANGFSVVHPLTEDSVEDVLKHQSLQSSHLAGWNSPRPERVPVPTYAPAVMAFGIVVFAMGLATVWYVCLIGSLVFAVAAWRWVGELQGE